MTMTLRMGRIRATGMEMGKIRATGMVQRIDVIMAFCAQVILDFG
jgi:hypothetical protein